VSGKTDGVAIQESRKGWDEVVVTGAKDLDRVRSRCIAAAANPRRSSHAQNWLPQLCLKGKCDQPNLIANGARSCRS